MDQSLACYTPADLHSAPAPDLSAYRWRLLAQGDSWFSSSAASLNAHANLLREMVFQQPICAVNCAGTSDQLGHIVDLAAAHDFRELLIGKNALVWDGLLLSVGGNDLFLAAQTPVMLPDGQAVPLHLRLLRHPTEWGKPSAGVGRYFSEPGWETYAEYLRVNIRHILTLRDQGPSAGKPVFMHCYAVPMPRPAGPDGSSLAWLHPALKACAVPGADWAAVSRLMIHHLVQLLKELEADKVNYPGLHIFESNTVPLSPATAGSVGSNGDWANEIHLNHSGCFKLARAWSRHIEDQLDGVKPIETGKVRRKKG